MRSRVAVILVGGGGKDAIVPPPSTTATVNNAAIGALGSILPLPPSTTTTIAAVDDHHHRCHTVNNDDCQKPAIVVCCKRRQLRSLLTEAAVDGGHGNGGLCQRWSPSTETAVGWRDNDAMASTAMASLADGGSGNGGGHCHLCRGGWCYRHYPVTGINGGSKDAIAAANINCHFHQQQLLSAIAAVDNRHC
jgi:hypothetical protein